MGGEGREARARLSGSSRDFPRGNHADPPPPYPRVVAVVHHHRARAVLAHDVQGLALRFVRATARVEAAVGVDVSSEGAPSAKSEVAVLRAPSCQILQTRMPSHPGQIEASVCDRV